MPSSSVGITEINIPSGPQVVPPGPSSGAVAIITNITTPTQGTINALGVASPGDTIIVHGLNFFGVSLVTFGNLDINGAFINQPIIPQYHIYTDQVMTITVPRISTTAIVITSFVLFGPKEPAVWPNFTISGPFVTWSSLFSNQATLDSTKLIAFNEPGSGPRQGTCVDPALSQSSPPLGSQSLNIYWEVKWGNLPSTLLTGGMGVCIRAAAAAQDFDNISTAGKNGVILYPDGTVVSDGNQVAAPQPGGGGFVPQQTGDTVGILAAFPAGVSARISFFGVGGSCLGAFSGGLHLVPFVNGPVSLVPCAVFDSGLNQYAQNANFGADPKSFLILPLLGNGQVFNGFLPDTTIFGWPGNIIVF